MTTLFDPETGEIAPTTPDKVLVAFALYQQEAARQEHWTTHRFINDPMRKSIKARLEEAGGLEPWREAIGIASRSEFLTGKIKGRDGKPFKLSLTFMLQPSSFLKILDGFYSREPAPPPRLHIPTGYQPPHLKPAEPFVGEDIEVRLAASVVSYRKYGKYRDANRVEEILAARQNRPPILVADPNIVKETTPRKPMPSRFTPNTLSDVDWEDVPEGAVHEADD